MRASSVLANPVGKYGGGRLGGMRPHTPLPLYACASAWLTCARHMHQGLCAQTHPALLSSEPYAGAGRISLSCARARAMHTCLHCPRRHASTSKNPYTVLGIRKSATKEEIKKAYRVMARKHHPDAPGGDHKKFQEIQEAYDQVKSGVWIPKNMEDAAGGGNGSSEQSSRMNRYSGFQYTTRTHRKSKVSYEEFYTEMHTGKVKRRAFEDEDDDVPEGEVGRGAEGQRNPFQMREVAFQAWLRFILMWCSLFIVLRVYLFVLFPPKWEKPVRKQPPPALRKRPPPPKPIAPTTSSSYVA